MNSGEVAVSSLNIIISLPKLIECSKAIISLFDGCNLFCILSKFSVAIIPYTLQHTNFHKIKKGTVVNLEFDIFGKYIAKMLNKKI